ncbi:DUF885 family protein [Nitratireductor kimnyeongensis]|uniref:DUF885 family protein n=1 Tax=Nitratireductor kimnyeongensis TaxID=430679 RepID=A0ABW0TDN4_9HYPH
MAKQAFDAAANRLASHLAPRAADRDGVGRERYLLASRQFLGTTIDVDETYAWGQEEVARLDAQMAEVADRIVPGASVGQAQDALDADPRYQIHGVDALARWMQERADEASAARIASRTESTPSGTTTWSATSPASMMSASLTPIRVLEHVGWTTASRSLCNSGSRGATNSAAIIAP